MAFMNEFSIREGHTCISGRKEQILQTIRSSELTTFLGSPKFFRIGLAFFSLVIALVSRSFFPMRKAYEFCWPETRTYHHAKPTEEAARSPKSPENYFMSIRRKPLVIGIAGVANSGKKTAAKNLCLTFPGSVIIHQETFFRIGRDIQKKENDCWKWEVTSAIDYDSMLKAMQGSYALLEQSDSDPDLQKVSSFFPKLLIVEGVFIFDHPNMNALMDRKFYLEVPKSECRCRRIRRFYDPPDVPGYFELIAWPMHEAYLRNLKKDRGDIRFVDGTGSPETVAKIIIEDIKRCFA